MLGELRQCDSERGKAGAKKPDRDLVKPMAIELNGLRLWRVPYLLQIYVIISVLRVTSS